MRKPHIGNTYEAILADSIARFKRLQGYEVFMQTGTDEHGQKIEEKAAQKGITPKEFVDGVASEIRGIWDLVGTSYDKFIRTTDADHEKQVQKIFKKLYEQGDIYKGHYEGMYCTPCESFFTPLGSQVALVVKDFPANAGDVRDVGSILGSGRRSDLEKHMATHSSILAWRIPWTEKPVWATVHRSQRVGHG